MIDRLHILCLIVFLVWPLGRAGGDEIPEVEKTDISEIGRLLKKLDDDDFDQRQEALAELEKLVACDDMKAQLATEFGRALLLPETSFEVRFHLQRLCRKLPKAQIEPQKNVSVEELGRLIDQLDDDSCAVRMGADYRLRWLLHVDENVESVRSIIEEKLEAELELSTRNRLQSISDFARPAMVAEYWQGRHCHNRQHLLIGVPSYTPPHKNPSHFDRIDDKTAHCVTGVTLSEGDYPVGVAFPHPKTQDAFFHLINLPTPRRKMDYENRPKQGADAKHLAELSRRTLDRILQQRRALKDNELPMLAQLSQAEVSRFAGEYFLQVEDEQFSDSDTGGYSSFRRGSRHGAVCERLAMEGTKEAMPRLIEAIDTGRFLPPTSRAPYHMQWIAALAIANRSPWPEVDDWLASLIERTDNLIEGRGQGPSLGATAAAILLKRHKESHRKYNLRRVGETFMQRCRLEAYAYPSEIAPEKVLMWWEQKKGEKVEEK